MNRGITQVDDVMPGKLLGAKTTALGARMVALYEEALDLRRPWYSEASPWSGPVVPPLLLASEPWGWPGAYLSYWQGGVASKMTWRSIRPVLVGAKVEVTAAVVDRFVRREREASVVECIARDALGEIVAGTGTYSAKVDPMAVRPDVRREDASAAAATPAPAPARGEPWVRELQVTREMSQAFWAHREDLGDTNFHVNPEAARSFGLKDVMIGSSQLAALAAEQLIECLGRAWIEGGDIAVTFTGMVTAGDRLRISAVELAAPDSGRRRFRTEITVGGTTVLVGSGSAPAAVGGAHA